MLFLFYGRDLVKDLDKRSQKRNTNKYSLNPSKDNYQHLDCFFSKSTPKVPQCLPAPRLLPPPAPGTFLGLGSVLPMDSAMGCAPQSMPSVPSQLCYQAWGHWLPKLTGSSRSIRVPGDKAWSSQGEGRKKKEQGARGASRPLAPKHLAQTVRYNRRWTKR